MLKIKSNINEFTIIFSEKIGKKINAEKLSAQPSLFNFSAAPFSVPALFFFQLKRLFLLLFSSGQRLFLLLFLFWSAPFFLLQPSFSFQFRRSFFASASFPFCPALTFSFLQAALYFSVQNTFFQPKLFLAQMFFSFSAQTFLLQFSHCSLFLFFCFILFWFSPLFSLSVPPFFFFSFLQLHLSKAQYSLQLLHISSI